MESGARLTHKQRIRMWNCVEVAQAKQARVVVEQSDTERFELHQLQELPTRARRVPCATIDIHVPGYDKS
jgi:hypothetical protein